MRFGLQLDKLKHISHEEFEQLNWLPVSYRFKYCVSSMTLRYFNEQYPNYLSEVFDVPTKKNCRNLKCQFHKSKNGQFALDIVKRTTNPNRFSI